MGRLRGLFYEAFACLQGAIEVEARDLEPLPAVEAMGVVALGARIEVELVSPLRSGELGQPGEKRRPATLGTSLRECDEIVDIQMAAPGEVLVEAKTRDRDRPGAIRQGCEVVAGVLLCANAAKEGCGVVQFAKALHHGVAGENGIVGLGEIDLQMTLPRAGGQAGLGSRLCPALAGGPFFEARQGVGDFVPGGFRPREDV